MRSYYAHTDGYEQCNQLLRDHNRNAAMIAAQKLKPIGLQHTAFLAGMLHDLGKYTERFQKYLLGEAPGRPGSVIHTFQPCKLMMERYHTDDAPNEVYLAAELISVAVGCHHGLFDCIDERGAIGLSYRSAKEGMDYEEAVAAFFSDCMTSEELDCMIEIAAKEIKKWIDRIDLNETNDKTEFDFSLGLLSRLLTSAVIEADRADTARFMNGTLSPAYPEDMRVIWEERLKAVECKLDALPNETAISAARRSISEQCRMSAEKSAGIYRLYVPTGGGKTLSALRYSLAHAKKYNKTRLIFTSPLLSILEQNAAQIRQYLGDDSLVLEHHSNVIQTEQTAESLDQRELMVESWEAPVIITTLVQLLNTLFAGKTTCVRRFHALCNSVIVIDEVQTVPVKLLSLFNRAVHFLSTYCGATVVLSSATQPSLEKAEHPLRGVIEDIVPLDAKLWDVFSRTRIEPLPAVREETLPGRITEEMEHTQSLLVVCNKKAEAARLVERTKGAGWTSFHLSAGMCIQHRRDVLKRMTDLLKAGKNVTLQQPGRKVLCISTQVIEAGVDISFERAMRFAAGMDSVVQTAGRCNRNGEAEQRCPVYLVNCTDENLGRLQDIRRGKDATVELLCEYERDPQHFRNDLSSDEAIRFFYHCLYRSMDKDAQNGIVYAADGRPKGCLYEYLSSNDRNSAAAGEAASAYLMRQAFKTAGKEFAVFDQETTDVLVPYGEGAKMIAALSTGRAKKDAAYRAALLKQATSFSVSLYSYQKKKLEERGALYHICGDSILALQESFYDDIIGLRDEPGNLPLLEV